MLDAPFGTITKRGTAFTVTLDIKKLRELGIVERVDGEDRLVDEEIQVTKLFDPDAGQFIIDLPDNVS